MATKWKNIIETGKRLLKQHWQVLVSVMLAGCGIFTFYILIAYRTYYPTEKILYFGILGNILLGSGTAYLLEKGLNRKYQNWIPKEDAYYREWRAEMKKMEHLLQVIGILAFAAAGIFFVLQSKFREYWSWYYNYAAGYV
ncbi:MAG: sensor histidine kinase, partial [Ruminococcus sp.]|nr:sensor histidine kinase [Ruminococcus sp.]